LWYLTGLENGKQVVKRTGVVGHGHKSLSTKRFVVESLSDIETFNFKALLTYHILILFNGPQVTLMMLSDDVVMVQSKRIRTFIHTALSQEVR